MNIEKKVSKITQETAKKFGVQGNTIGAMWIEQAVRKSLELGRGRAGYLRRGRKSTK